MQTPNDRLSDPEIIYDSSSNRWYLSILDFGQNGSPECTSNNNPNLCFIFLAVSKTDVPTGDWQLYSFNWKNVLPDQPRMAVNLDKVVISANDYPPNKGEPGADILVIDKGALVSGLNANFQSTGSLINEFSIVPAKSVSPSSCTFLVSVGKFQSQVLKYSEVCGDPARGSVTFNINKALLDMAPSIGPFGALQPTNRDLDTGHGQMSSVAYFNGKIWDAFNDNCIIKSTNENRDCIRIQSFEVNNLGSGLLVDKDIAIPKADSYLPALIIDNLGNMKILFSFSSKSQYPSLLVADKNFVLNDDANSIKVLRQGTSPVINIDPRNQIPRYGDYYGAAIDPVTNSIWAVGEYGDTRNSPSWSTFVGNW